MAGRGLSHRHNFARPEEHNNGENIAQKRGCACRITAPRIGQAAGWQVKLLN